MKAFLKAYVVCLILMEVFIFFGGWMLFDLRGTGIYRAGAVIAPDSGDCCLRVEQHGTKGRSAGSGASGVKKANQFGTIRK
ncbi:MAG: hypothetical protein V8R27_07360 [Oscillospiraceae bacterium]